MKNSSAYIGKKRLLVNKENHGEEDDLFRGCFLFADTAAECASSRCSGAAAHSSFS